MPQMRSFVVVLNFDPPGPLNVGSWIAPDEVSAVALATVSVMRQNTIETELQSVLVIEETAEMLRTRLHAIEGKPAGAVVTFPYQFMEKEPVDPVGRDWSSALPQRAAERPDLVSCPHNWENGICTMCHKLRFPVPDQPTEPPAA